MMLVQLLVEVEELAALWDTLSVNVVSTAITAEPQVKFVMMTVASNGLKKTQSRNQNAKEMELHALEIMNVVQEFADGGQGSISALD